MNFQKKNPRKGWARAFKEMHRNGDDELLLPDWWDELPDNVQRDIITAEKEIEEGKGIPHEEMLKKYGHRIKK